MGHKDSGGESREGERRKGIRNSGGWQNQSRLGDLNLMIRLELGLEGVGDVGCELGSPLTVAPGDCPALQQDKLRLSFRSAAAASRSIHRLNKKKTNE